MIPVVVKVGGSLYDDPRLGPGLRKFFDSLEFETLLLVPGGGASADAVRDLQICHSLSESNAHWLAIQAMEMMSSFLHYLLRRVYDGNPPSSIWPLDPYFEMTENFQLPESWDVTSDSIAATIATRRRASKLVLLKSVDIPPGTPWTEAAARGWVDGYFPTAVADATFPIESINFRSWLNEHFPPPGVG